MTDLPAPVMVPCAQCGRPYESTRNRPRYCKQTCRQQGEYVEPVHLTPWLDALSRKFVAAVLADQEYVIELAVEGSRQAARQAA